MPELYAALNNSVMTINDILKQNPHQHCCQSKGLTQVSLIILIVTVSKPWRTLLIWVVFISKDNGVQKDIKARLENTRWAFAKLQNNWKSKYTMKRKLRLYNSNVNSILMYGSECWRLVKGDMAKIDAFHNGCLKKICWIFWPNKISNVELHKKTGCKNAVLEMKR